MRKSANQLWRESHSTLSFKEWLQREKDKYATMEGTDSNYSNFIPNIPLQAKINETIDEIRKDTGFKTEASKNKVLGLNQTVVIIAGVIIAGAIGYKIYKNYKK
jgi:hypothetical protein